MRTSRGSARAALEPNNEGSVIALGLVRHAVQPPNTNDKKSDRRIGVEVEESADGTAPHMPPQ